jgi:hypothetical protein
VRDLLFVACSGSEPALAGIPPCAKDVPKERICIYTFPVAAEGTKPTLDDLQGFASGELSRHSTRSEKQWLRLHGKWRTKVFVL